MMKRFPFLTILVLSVTLGFISIAQAEWYKGNTHAHSFWSDGDTLPEMEAKWYKDHGYNFLALSDHNTSMMGKKLKSLEIIAKKVPDLPKYLAEHAKAFGPDAITYAEKDGKKMVLLKTFDEVKKMTEVPGIFLPIQANEVTDKAGGKQTHATVVNIRENVGKQKTDTPAESFKRIARDAKKAAKKHGLNSFWQLNHPSWPRYDVTPELLASLTDYNLFEVANCISSANVLGDKDHWSCEKLWDVANTIRLGKMKTHPLFGIASDDAHRYHIANPKKAIPGRGFVMVRADKLETNAIVDAIKKGDFYASTGVILKELKYDPRTKTLKVKIDPKKNTKYTIEFIGTCRGVSPKRSIRPHINQDCRCVTRRCFFLKRFKRLRCKHHHRYVTRSSKQGQEQPKYSDAVGRVFKRVKGTSGSYTLRGNELYIRAAIRSNRKMERPPTNNNPTTEQAWTQPVGWKK